MSPKYEAVGRVVFHRGNESGTLGLKGVDPLVGMEDPEDRAAIDTQIGILETDALATQVISDLHLERNPNFAGGLEPAGNEERLAELFHRNLRISKVKGTRLIEIRFRNRDPRLAADVVNDLSKAYVDRNFMSQFQASTHLSEFLVSQVKELEGNVKTSQQKLIDYQKENGIFGLDSKQNIVTAKLEDLNRELTAAETDRVQKEVNFRLANSGKPELVAKLEPGNLVTALRARQSELENQVALASVQLGPANPKMVELTKQLAQTQQAVEGELSRIADRISYDYRSSLGRERMLRRALEKQKQVADALSATAIQSNILSHEFETNRKLYEDLQEKQKELGISAGLKSSNIWIVDPAIPPSVPVEPNFLRNFGLALVFGLAGGVGLAFGLEKMNQKIYSLNEAQTLSPLPALGSIPLLDAKTMRGAFPGVQGIPAQLKPEMVSLQQPLSLATESFKLVLTSLLYSQSAHPGVILVTSALPGEGKTAVSTNLAILLARLNRRVLLVDADFRRPSVHRALQISANSGLGALLRKTAKFEEAVILCARVPNLFVLPVGPVNLPDDAELLLAEFGKLLEGWRNEFDHIIIDTPPTLAMTDAVSMSVEADSVILVLRSGQVAKDAFLRAQALLRGVNARLTGFVLNCAEVGVSEFKYYYGYYGQDPKKIPQPGA
ncbi:MAG: polysaccharide biosynthesis tyrosine autokinase [Acidobacteria bacterium]|nr:polysaccharide biosynthesis tyrosine autokinase [Acidobacteriota bacterium]